MVTIASAAGLAGVAGLGDCALWCHSSRVDPSRHVVTHCARVCLADCASKFGAVGFDEAMRQEIRKLGRTGVHTTCVCPFYIKTGMFDGVKSGFPLLPLLEPGERARLAAQGQATGVDEQLPCCYV